MTFDNINEKRFNIVVQETSEKSSYWFGNIAGTSCDPLTYWEGWKKEDIDEALKEAKRRFLDAWIEEIKPEFNGHTIEDVNLEKHGYGHDNLIYLADGEYQDVDGEFYIDRDGMLHYSHIFDDNTEIEFTIKY